MTINTNDTRNEYTATASQSVFTYDFKIFTSTDLNVYHTPAGQECTDSDLTTAYTVSGVGNEGGGSVTLTTPASSGDLITIVSDIPESRTTDYQTNGDFLPDTVNDDFDRVVSLVKQAQTSLDRSPQFHECLQGAAAFSLPKPTAGAYLRTKDDLTGYENVNPVTAPQNPNTQRYKLQYTDGSSGIGISGSSLDVVLGVTLVSGDQVETDQYDSTRVAGSGAVFQYTGTTTAGKAGNCPDADGYFYDADGKQLLIAPVYHYPSLKQYGAAFDDSTDDTDAIKAAVAGAIAQDGVLIINAGTAKVTSTITISDTLTMIGFGRQKSIIKSYAVSGDVLYLSSGEETVLQGFQIASAGTPTTGIQIEPSYITLRDMKVFITDGSSDFTIAAIQTSTTTNVNQFRVENCEIRSQSSPGGTTGLRINRGANITIDGGYYGDFDSCIMLGANDIVTNCTIGGGVIIETFDPQNSATAVCIDVRSVAAFKVSGARMQVDAVGHRHIKVSDGVCRGMLIEGNSFDGTSAATSGITFDGNASEEALAVVIGANEIQSIGSASTNFIELINSAEPNIDVIGGGINSIRGSANRPIIDPFQFADGDTTPSVAAGNFFVTANTAATSITDLDGCDRVQNKVVYVQFGDTNTTIKFSTVFFRGNNGIDYTPTSIGESMICHQYDTIWVCVLS